MRNSEFDQIYVLNERPDLRRRLTGLYFAVSGLVMLAAVYVASLVGQRIAALPVQQAQELRNVPLILVVCVAGALAVGLAIWLFTIQRIIGSVERLLDVSEAIRWRGHLEPKESSELTQLAQRPAQIGSLARSIQAMEQEMGSRFQQLNTLLRTSRLVAASLDADTVIDNIFDQMQALFGVDRCSVVTWDERAKVLTMVASRGMDSYEERYNLLNQETRELPSVRALRNQAPVQVSDTENDLAFVAFRVRARQEGFRSVLAIPLLTRHAAPASLILYKSEPYRYSYTELELASSFGNHAAVALENAALYGLSDERLQDQTQRLEAIVESMRDGLILASPAGEVLYCNQQAAALVGRDAQTVVGSNSAEITTPFFDGVSAENEQQIEVSRDNPRQDLRVHMFNVSDQRGQLIGRGQLWQDVTHDKELDRMKSALLSTVSHELRTPLATIKGYASTLLAPDVVWDATAQREFIQTISDETDRLTTLVKNLLDMSRIEAGSLFLNREPYALDELAWEVISSFPINAQKRVIADLDQLDPAPLDRLRISTVIRNLIDNALKYSPSDRPVQIFVFESDGRAMLTVTDQGEGVSDEHRDHIFERFYRADNGLNRRSGGVGLGLSICKGFVEAHGGMIEMNSAETGSSFTVSLPLATQH